MKLQFFSLTPSVPGVNMLRLKDGVYSRVPLLPGASVEVRRKVLCEDAGTPVSQVWARALDKELYPMLINSVIRVILLVQQHNIADNNSDMCGWISQIA